MAELTLTFHLIDDYAKCPQKAYKGDLGYDFFAAEDTILAPKSSVVINTGVALTLPKNYGMLLCTRSSHASKGITVEGGVIDNTYSGNIKIILYNHTDNYTNIVIGNKIAQGILVHIPHITVFTTDQVPARNKNEQRNTQGFGSTGS